MKKWRGLFYILLMMGGITLLGLTLGQKPITMGTLRETYGGKDQRILREQLGPPQREIKRPQKPGITLVYSPLILTREGHNGGYVLFDLDAQGQVTDIYIDHTLGP